MKFILKKLKKKLIHYMIILPSLFLATHSLSSTSFFTAYQPDIPPNLSEFCSELEKNNRI